METWEQMLLGQERSRKSPRKEEDLIALEFL